MAVTISGMFGSGHTYFAGSPVVITISGLEWGETVTSPFTIVRVYVYYNGRKVGEFHEDTGGQTTATFDIKSALMAIWADYDFSAEVAAAQLAKASTAANASFVAETDDVNFFDEHPGTRKYRSYSIEVFTEYLDSTDGEFTQSPGVTFDGGQCAIGSFTEWERSIIPSDADADVSYREHENLRYGDASTKPTESPERVGRSSITSWVDVSNSGTQSVFYPASATAGEDSQSAHAPLVLRDSQEYVDFLFLNRRGAIETCSGMTKEAMQIDVDMKQYARVERPTFRPSRSLMAIGSDGRRSWQMSSGYVTREWAEWWAMEFLGGKRKRWWMKYKGPGQATAAYVPVIVEPSKKSIGIYDHTKQQMPHVDFTVTLALEG